MNQYKPNVVCKNPNCKHGKDGKPKEYYVCRFCVRTKKWNIVACCPECYDEYISLLMKERNNSNNKTIDTKIKVKNMTKAEMDKLNKTPVEEVRTEVVEELKQTKYADNLSEFGISGAVEAINKDIDKNQHIDVKQKTSKKKSSTKAKGKAK